MARFIPAADSLVVRREEVWTIDSPHKILTGIGLVTPSYYSYWAKTERDGSGYHLLPHHLLDVAACMRALLTQQADACEHLSAMLGIADGAIDVVVWLAGLHDVGKFADSFQGLAPDLQAALGTTKPYSKPYQIKHDALGKYVLGDRLQLKTKFFGLDEVVSASRERRKTLETILEAVAGHHGRPCREFEAIAAGDAFGQQALEDAKQFIADWSALMNPAPQWLPWSAEHFNERVRIGSWVLAGWMVLADWLGSNATFFPFHEQPIAKTEENPLAAYWELAQRRAMEAVSQSGVVAPRPRQFTGLDTLFPGFTPTPMQAHAVDAPLAEGAQLFILEDVTGSGKTEAAMVLASRLMNAGHTGVYFGLPTTATANGMFARMRSAYREFFEGGEPSIVLAHASRAINEEFQSTLRIASASEDHADETDADDLPSEAFCARWLGDTARKALLAPFGVGTIDQALLGVLPVSHQSLRLVGLAGKVLVIDEVHGYDTYMTELLEKLLRFHAAQGGSAILLSATLPTKVRSQLAQAFQSGLGNASALPAGGAYPLATHVSDGASTATPIVAQPHSREQMRHRVAVELVDDLDAAVDHLTSAAKAGRCAVWIRNTVNEAVSGFERVRNAAPDPDKVILFHARFTLSDRHAIEREVLRRFGKGSSDADRAGWIVVATQVVEQSLDLDFDHMVADLAPIDLIIQRAGRLQRHDRGSRPAPKLLVLGPLPCDEVAADWYASFFDGARWVYEDHARLWMTARALRDAGEIRVPEAARALVDAVYSGEDFPESLTDTHLQRWGQDQAARALAKFASLDVELGYRCGQHWTRDTHATTRLGDKMTRLRLARLEGQRLEPWATGHHHWTMSEVSVRAYNVKEVVYDDASEALVKAANRAMFDRAKYCHTVPMRPIDGERWVASVRNAKNEVRTLCYSPRFGLQITQEPLDD